MDSCIVGGVAEILLQEDAATGLAPPSSDSRQGNMPSWEETLLERQIHKREF